MKVSAVVKSTGEVIEQDVDTPEQIQAAWLMASDLEKAAKAIKDQLKPLVDPLLNGRGTSEPLNGFMFRQTNVQRYNYDKAMLRKVIEDEDVLDTFLEPNKKAVDTYLKENLESLGEGSTLLRESMVPLGQPFSAIRLERLK